MHSHKESKAEVILLLFSRFQNRLIVASVFSQTPVKVTKSKNSIFAIEWLKAQYCCVPPYGKFMDKNLLRPSHHHRSQG